MPHPHGSDCRCPPPAPDDGLLAYTIDCEHYDALSALLARIAGAPSPSPAAVPMPSDDAEVERALLHREQWQVFEAARPEPAQPWEPRAPRQRRAA